MEKLLFLFILLFSAVFEVRCLQCYVCDNCAKVKLQEIQTCGMTTTPRPVTSTSTSIQPPTTSTIAASMLPTISSTTDSSTITSETTPGPVTTPPIIAPESTIDDRNIATTSDPNTISPVTTRKPIANVTSPTTFSTPSLTSTTSEGPTTTAPTSPEVALVMSTTERLPIITVSTTPISEPLTSTEPETNYTTLKPQYSANFTTVTSGFANVPIESVSDPVISVLTSTEESTITSSNEPSVLSSTEEPSSTTPSATSEFATIPTEFVSEPVISVLTSTEESSITFSNEPGVLSSTEEPSSTLSTTPATSEFTTIPTESITDPVISVLTSTKESSITFSTEPNVLSSTEQSNPTFLTEPAAVVPLQTNLTMTEASIPATTAIPVITPEPTIQNKPSENMNEMYKNQPRIRRSSPGDCNCKGEQNCECLISRLRPKRYALRGPRSEKENVKYVCVVDKFRVNGTEIVRRGCAVMEENQETSCINSGFGANCKTCEKNQCNSASTMIIPTFLWLFFAVQYFKFL